MHLALSCTGGPEMPARAGSRLRKGSGARARRFEPRAAPATAEHRSEIVLFEACLGFVSKDDYSEPFIAALWDSLPGPASILQGVFQKAKAVLCNMRGRSLQK